MAEDISERGSCGSVDARRKSQDTIDLGEMASEVAGWSTEVLAQCVAEPFSQMSVGEEHRQKTTIWIEERPRKRMPDRREEGEVASPKFYILETPWNHRGQRK
ncbi:hypothetical protein CRE_05984 [Caenorhabditis remanei]|uniref:Uncharacterized protein n=1 Tax=Caenorhabditis remanei TaxID=31234 RepID=E3MZD9_CAERE|nr:hypothetical protein CRE_05984 [Caenorhabditis remanei]